MPDIHQHIIRRHVLNVELFGTESDGFALQRRLPSLCQDWLMPALEPVLERSSPTDEHLTIERLEIDAGTFSLDHLERDLVEAVTRALEKSLRERVLPASSIGDSGRIQRRTQAQSVEDALLHFLQTGALPWWFHLPAGKPLEDAVQESWRALGQAERLPEIFRRKLTDAIAAVVVRRRLVRQFSADFLRTLLASLSEEAAAAIDEVLSKLGSRDVAAGPPVRVSEQLWQTVFTLVAAGRRPTVRALVAEYLTLLASEEWHEPALVERMTELWPEALSRAGKPRDRALPGSDRVPLSSRPTKDTRRFPDRPAAQTKQAAREETGARIDLKEGLYIACAGLVLLHPFLPRLFGALGIAAQDRLMRPERALCLLHFLATGQRHAPEYELLLPKLLCNVPLEQPVDSWIELTTAEEEEAVALLEAVIHHWDALGDTSIDGLRGTFLVRPGKLSQRDNGDDLLQVESRSFDILLDRLPWSTGMIRLPWMKKSLWVEWRS